MLRTFTNAPGAEFDADKTDVIYAEDMNDTNDTTANLRPNLDTKSITNIAHGITASPLQVTLPILDAGEACIIETMFLNPSGASLYGFDLNFDGATIATFSNNANQFFRVEILISNGIDSSERQGWVKVTAQDGTVLVDQYWHDATDFSGTVHLKITVKNNHPTTTYGFGYMYLMGRVWKNKL